MSDSSKIRWTIFLFSFDVSKFDRVSLWLKFRHFFEHIGTGRFRNLYALRCKAFDFGSANFYWGLSRTERFASPLLLYNPSPPTNYFQVATHSFLAAHQFQSIWTSAKMWDFWKKEVSNLFGGTLQEATLLDFSETKRLSSFKLRSAIFECRAFLNIEPNTVLRCLPKY